MADTFVGTSNFGNTNITGKLAVTEKIEAKDGSIAESSKEVVTGGQLYTVKTALEAADSALGGRVTVVETYVTADGINANSKKITNVADGNISSAASKEAVNGGQLYTAQTTLQTGIDELEAAVEAKEISITADSGEPYKIMGANGAFKVAGSANIDTAVDGSGNVTVSLKDAVSITDLTINGNLTVSGTTTTVNSENTTIKDNVITLNAGESGEGVAKGTCGIEIDRGSATKYQVVFDEADDKLKIGEEGTLKAVSTEEYVDTKVAETVSNGVTQIQSGQWHMYVTDDDSFVIEYGGQLVAKWAKPTE